MNKKIEQHKGIKRGNKGIFTKVIRFPIEAFFAYFFFGLFYILPFSWTSAIGGFLGRTLCYWSKTTDIARHNLRLVFPNMKKAEMEKLIIKMWDGLARTFIEYSHTKKFKKYIGKYVFVKGLENVKKIEDSGRPCVLFSAHYGNWEMVPEVFLKSKVIFNPTYRAPNNPMVDYLFRNVRKSNTKGVLIEKGSFGAKKLIDAMNNNQMVGIMADQKFNQGIQTSFFNKKVMTAPAMARLALKYNALILPVKCTRFQKNKNIVEALPPFSAIEGKDTFDSVEKTMQKITSIVEDWVKEDPTQWMWVHARFGKFWKKTN